MAKAVDQGEMIRVMKKEITPTIIGGFKSAAARIAVRIAALGFLGALGFIPGWERLFGFTGLFGFLGAGDDGRGGHHGNVTVASHLCLRCGHLLERRDGLLRAELLIETDDSIENDDVQDGDGVQQFAQHPGDDTGRDENPDDKALELTKENLQRAGCACLLSVR